MIGNLGDLVERIAGQDNERDASRGGLQLLPGIIVTVDRATYLCSVRIKGDPVAATGVPFNPDLSSLVPGDPVVVAVQGSRSFFAISKRAVPGMAPPSGAVVTGSVVYDPPSLADNAGTTTTLAVSGASLGDYASASFSLDLQGIQLTAWVSAADVVSVRLFNKTGGVINLASGTLRARVQKQ